MMNDLIELFDQFQQHLIEKQKFIDIQREDVHHSINRTFNKIFEQLIEIRRFCRNDIEQQTLNAQVNSSKNFRKKKHQFQFRLNYNRCLMLYNICEQNVSCRIIIIIHRKLIVHFHWN